METFITIILMLVLSAVAQYMSVWWAMTLVVLLLSAWRNHSAKQSFGTGFASVALLWLLFACCSHYAGDGRLTARISLMFKLPHPSMLILLTAVLGGVVAGMASLTGFYLKTTIARAK